MIVGAGSHRPVFGHRDRHWVMALKHPSQPLVYVRTLKCASTFFYYNFWKNFGWQEIAFNQILWPRVTVFSHVVEPAQRRAKGLAEYLEMHDLMERYWDDPTFQRFVHDSVCLDEHSLSIEMTYSRELCQRIHWLPVLKQHQTVEITTAWLQNQGCDTDQWNFRWLHLGTVEKRRISDHIAQQPMPEHVILALDYDLEIYHRAVSKLGDER